MYQIHASSAIPGAKKREIPSKIESTPTAIRNHSFLMSARIRHAITTSMMPVTSAQAATTYARNTNTADVGPKGGNERHDAICKSKTRKKEDKNRYGDSRIHQDDDAKQNRDNATYQKGPPMRGHRGN